MAYLILGGCGRNNLVEITTEIYLRLCGDAFEKGEDKRTSWKLWGVVYLLLVIFLKGSISPN